VRGLKALKGMRVFVYPFLVGNLNVYAAPVPACTNGKEQLKAWQHTINTKCRAALSSRHINNTYTTVAQCRKTICAVEVC